MGVKTVRSGWVSVWSSKFQAGDEKAFVGNAKPARENMVAETNNAAKNIEHTLLCTITLCPFLTRPLSFKKYVATLVCQHKFKSQCCILRFLC